jgi:hypothetical protein
MEIAGGASRAWAEPREPSKEGVGTMFGRVLVGKRLARVLLVAALVFGLLALFKGNVFDLTSSQEAGLGVCLLAAAAWMRSR